jgi:hypothetical protein
MNRAGSATKLALRSSRATPTMIVTVPVMASIGRLSARMRLRDGAPILNAAATTATATRIRVPARTCEKTGMPIRYVATTRAGRVRMSPQAVIMGAAMLSMSHPRATLRRATTTVMPSKSTPAIIPPTVEMTT